MLNISTKRIVDAEKMTEPEQSQCPYCGAPISGTDKYCKNCGKVLIKYSDIAQPQPQQPWSEPLPPEEAYERKYSMFQRFYKLVLSPSEAMEDVGKAPDYGGPLILVILRIIIGAIAIALAFQKIQWIGDSGIISQVSGILSGVITLAVVISVFLLIAFWLGKSFIVKHACDGGSGWTFQTAASVTGYAYIADFIFGIIGLIALYALIPPITFNVSNMDATRQALADYQAQVLSIRLLFSIPVSFIALLWKSYLGALGTKSGTDKKASVSLGFFVFFILGLVGWLISFLTTNTI
jgi:hypothetical protein